MDTPVETKLGVLKLNASEASKNWVRELAPREIFCYHTLEIVGEEFVKNSPFKGAIVIDQQKAFPVNF